MGDTEPDDRAMRARLDALGRDLAGTAAKPKGDGPSSAAGMGSALNLGARVMSEFVAAVAVGGFIGWLLDRWLHTSPLLLIVFIALGTAAGFWSVYRVASRPTSL